MTKKRTGQSAEEFIAELQRDSNFLRRRAERDEKTRLLKQRLDLIEKPILKTLEDEGFPATSIEAAVAQYAPLPSAMVRILLDALFSCTDERIQEVLVRALGAAQSPFNGQALVKLFDSTSNEGLRFCILNTIALAHPASIEKWLEVASQNEYLRQKLADLGHTWP